MIDLNKKEFDIILDCMWRTKYDDKVSEDEKRVLFSKLIDERNERNAKGWYSR